jgi:hypothetical protein
MSKYLIPYSRMIADALLYAVPQMSWGNTVFSATYMELCTRVEGEVGGPHWLSSPSIALDPRALRHRLAEGRPLPVRPAAR